MRKILTNGANNVAVAILREDNSGNHNLRKRKRGNGDEADDNPKLKEFLEVMQPPSKSRTWANEDSAGPPRISQQATLNQVQKAEAHQSDEEYEAVPQKGKRSKKSEDVDEPVGSAELANTMGKEMEGIANGSKGAEHGNVLELVPEKLSEPPSNTMPVASDEDWLRSRTSRLLGLVDDDDASESRCLPQGGGEPLEDSGVSMQPSAVGKFHASVQTDEDTHEQNPVAAKQTITGNENTGVSTGRLFVRNLVYTTTEHDLRKHFEAHEYGSIEEV